MRIHTHFSLVVTALTCLPWLSAVAAAQDDRGAVVSGSASATAIESNTDIAFSGTFGYRFSRVFGLEIEATAVPSLHGGPFDDFPVIQTLLAYSVIGASPSVQIFPPPTFTDSGGRLVIFTNNARVEIPTLSDRVLPYFVAGGGIASTRRTAQFSYLLPAGASGSTVSIVPSRPIAQPLVTASTDLALTMGGGVGVRVTRRMSIDADLRLFRLLAAEDVNVGRFGVGVRYRF